MLTVLQLLDEVTLLSKNLVSTPVAEGREGKLMTKLECLKRTC